MVLYLNWVQKLIILISSVQKFVNPNIGGLHFISNPFLLDFKDNNKIEYLILNDKPSIKSY
jgi:hypothetical protein